MPKAAAALQRCFWSDGSDLYDGYHDHEWGRPVTDDVRLFEKISLEGFQAGLSWITILRKRDSFRECFEGFDPERVARWGEPEIARALQNPGIIRHRGKIEATVTGARIYLDIEGSEGFSPFIWSFVGGRPIQNSLTSMKEVQAKTLESEAMAKALKKRGFKFCGPVITYAFMQACGLVNDHMIQCPQHARVKALSPAG